MKRNLIIKKQLNIKKLIKILSYFYLYAILK